MCDSLVSLTDDGPLFAKNSDRDPNESQYLDWVPQRSHPVGAVVACTWIEVPQVGHTHAVLLSRPWWMWGAEMGANQHGVVIGNEAVFTRAADGEKALLGMDLVRLALERAATADEAVSVMVDLLERHGQGGPCSRARPDFTYDNSFLVVDPRGATVLETAGRRWATEPVSGAGRSISNGLTIPSFAKAHSRSVRTWKSGAAVRRRLTEPMARQAAGPAHLMAALRRHGTGSTPGWSPVRGGLRAPCVHGGGLLTSSQTTGSWVSDLRGGVRHWATASAAPCTSLFKPVAVDQPVDTGPRPDDHFDGQTTWWRHESLHRRTLVAHGALAPLYAVERDRTEREWIAHPPSSVAAFAEGDRLEHSWLAAVSGRAVRDTRPWWVRRSWRVLDDAAGMERMTTG